MTRKQYSEEVKASLVKGVRDAVRKEGYSVTDACKQVRIHRSQYYAWEKAMSRVEAGEVGALSPRSRRPKRFGRAITEELREEVIRLAKSGRFRSANAIAKHLTERGRKIHPGTVVNVLENAGLYGEIKSTRADGTSIKKRGFTLSGFQAGG